MDDNTKLLQKIYELEARISVLEFASQDNSVQQMVPENIEVVPELVESHQPGESISDNPPSDMHPSDPANPDSALEVMTDSEAATPTSKSIEHNTAHELMIRGFRQGLPRTTDTGEDISLVVRDNSGSAPVVKYLACSDLPGNAADSDSSPDSTTESIEHNTAHELRIKGFNNAEPGITPAQANKNGIRFLVRYTSAGNCPKVGYVQYDNLLNANRMSFSYNVVTDVKYDKSSHELYYIYTTFSFTHGLLTSVTESSSQKGHIDTAVEETV